jgi:hypothetical protein
LADFDQFEAERFEVGEDAVECGLVAEFAREGGLVAALPDLQLGEAERIVSPRWPRMRIW